VKAAQAALAGSARAGPAGPSGPAGGLAPRGRGTVINLRGSWPPLAIWPRYWPSSQGDCLCGFKRRTDKLYVWERRSRRWVGCPRDPGRQAPAGPQGPAGPGTGPEGCWRRWPRLALLASRHSRACRSGWRRCSGWSRHGLTFVGNRPAAGSNCGARSLVICNLDTSRARCISLVLALRVS